MGNRTPPPRAARPPVPPPAPVRPRAAGGVAGVGVAPRPRVVLPPPIFGPNGPPGGSPGRRTRKQRKQRKQTRKQKQQKN
jgi:hypothetical protein